MTSAEQLLYTTVRIITHAGGKRLQQGTGFFWRIDEGEGKAFLLITNKHVIEGANSLTIICNGLDPSTGLPTGQPALVNIEITTPAFGHSDPNVDLCGLGFNQILENSESEGTPIFIKALDRSLIPTQEQWDLFDAIEDVLMIGCPRGIYDEVNRLPIARRGITATPLNNPYQGRSEFLVDMACFPGSSGSPILVFDRGGFSDRSGTHIGASRLFIAGVLYAGPKIGNNGEIVLGQMPTVNVATMMHLGQVIRSTEILDIENQVREHLRPPTRK